jgi:hypothetical protein
MKSAYTPLFYCLLIVIINCSCTKIEKKQDHINEVETSGAIAAKYQNPFGVLINKSSNVNLSTNDKIALVHDLGVQYVRLSTENSNWYDSAGHANFLNAYKSFTTSNPPIQVLLNISWKNEATGPVPFPGATTEYKEFINSIIDTLTSGRYLPPAIVVVENEENNPNFHSINTLSDLDNYVAQLKYVTDICRQKQIKVANGGITTLGINLLVWDYYKNVLKDSIKANKFLSKIAAPGTTIDFTTKKMQNKIQIVKTLINDYALIDFDYFNFHWYEPVQALFWNDTVRPTTIDTNHISPGVLAEVSRYLRVNSPIAGRTIITNEAGQVTNSPYIPEEITCALQNFPIVSWYSGDGTFGEANRLYKSKALHNAQRASPFYTLRSSGLAFKTNIAGIISDPLVYCAPLSR